MHNGFLLTVFCNMDVSFDPLVQSGTQCVVALSAARRAILTEGVVVDEAWMASNGAPLLDLLLHTDFDVQEGAIRLMCSLVYKSPAARTYFLSLPGLAGRVVHLIVRGGGHVLRPWSCVLTATSRKPCCAILSSACAAIWIMGTLCDAHAAFQDTVWQQTEVLLPALIHMSQLCMDEVQMGTVWLLRRVLSCSQQRMDYAMQHGAAKALSHVLASGSQIVMELAASTILHMATGSKGRQAAFLAAGALPVIAALLPVAHPAKFQSLVACVASCLVEKHQTAQAQLVECLPTLLQVLSHADTSLDAKAHLATAIFNSAGKIPDMRTRLGDCGLVDVLLEALIATPSTDLVAMERFLVVLISLTTMHPENQKRLCARMESIAVLIKLSILPAPRIQGLAAGLIRSASDGQNAIKALLVAYGALAHLLLNFLSTDYFSREQAVAAVYTLLLNQPGHLPLWGILGGTDVTVAVIVGVCHSTALAHLCAMLILKRVLADAPALAPALTANLPLQHALVRLFYSTDQRLKTQARSLLQVLHQDWAVQHAAKQIRGAAALDALPLALSQDCCPICMEDLDKEVEGQASISLPCFHVFHGACIQKWLVGSGQDSCPMCKLPVMDALAASMVMKSSICK